jgi:glycosyl transferase, family 25
MQQVTRMQVVPVFVISLARATDRRAAISRHLERLGIEYEIIDAVDGANLSKVELSRRVAPECTVHPGAIGCYLSHIQVYERVVAQQARVALVLEDDARVDPRVKLMLEGAFHSLDFDYCFLDSDSHNDQGAVFYDAESGIVLADGILAHELSAGPQTLHSYFISLDGARKRLAHAYPITRPIDLYAHLPYTPRFRAIVSPKLAWVGEQSLTSSTSAKFVSVEELRFRFLRKYPWFYRVRNSLLMRSLRRRLRIPRLVAEGRLARGRKWRPLPDGRDVLLGP